MLVEDLRQECRLRKLATSGPKMVLIKRLRAAVTQEPDLPRYRMVKLLLGGGFFSLLSGLLLVEAIPFPSLLTRLLSHLVAWVL